ncbi:MAG TPA: hypothetical protein VFB38_21170 [Chthonomonadaceae bacterium]|nr:hypothetical protein [Chthonomonadaceae bacterium]
MEFYVLLAVATIAIVVLGGLVWLRTRNLAFPIGIFFLYYWSLYGGWSIVTDKLGGDSGKHYYYLEDKLFAIQLDDNYFWSLAFYALFIIAVEIAILIFIRPERKTLPVAPLEISHPLLIALSGLSGLASYLIIRPSIAAAQAMNMSAYLTTRGVTQEVPPFFTVHQELNRMALVPAALGLAIACSGRNPKYITGARGRWTVPAYLGVLLGMFLFTLILGNKNELFYTGVGAFLLYLVNAERPNRAALVGLGALGGVCLALVDMLRGVPLPQMLDFVSTMSFEDVKGAMEFLGTSDEAFGAHFSMYGALTFKVPLTYGSSLVSLAASVVPRDLWPDRPEDVYFHYANSVQAVAGQGYTIHHATGWYLNFGVPGIIIGGLVLGWVWAKCFNSFYCVASARTRWGYLLAVLSPWMLTASLPALVRAGIEAYKGVALEAFLIPVVMLGLASYRWRPLPLAVSAPTEPMSA